VKPEFGIAFATGSDVQFLSMKKLSLVSMLAITSLILSSCASNEPASPTTTTTHQQGTGLPSQTMERHGM